MQHMLRGVGALAVASALVTTAFVTAGQAGTARAPACPAPYPVDQVSDGMPGWGLTVSKGTKPERFTVKAQGVLKDGIGPGIDMILAEADSPALRSAGAIWAGMSGSPVYAPDGRLLGAVGYGFSGTSRLAGITPAKAMFDIWKNPDRARAQSARGPVHLPRALQQKVTSRGLVSAAAAARGLSPLPLPYGVSGLSERRVNDLNKMLAAKGSKVRLHKAAAADGRPGDPAEAVAGGNFGVLQSYGMVTQGAIGTTTVVCGDRALAFGHPYFSTPFGPLPGGPVRLTAVSGEALAIVPDSAFGPFKLAGFGGVIGTHTQDRFAGIAARLGAGPKATPISARTTFGGTTRTFVSSVNRTEDVPAIALNHTVASLDRARDQISGGRSSTTWKLRGTAGGRPWELTFGNMFSGAGDATFPAGVDVAGRLAALSNNPYTKVTFTGLQLTASVDNTVGKYTLDKLLVKSGGRWVVLNPARTLKVTGGATLAVRARLVAYRAPTKTVDVRLKVPGKPQGTVGALSFGGGLDRSGVPSCDPVGDPDACAALVREQTRSFADLLAKFKAAPQNNDLLGALTLGGAKAGAKVRLDQIVNGEITIPVKIG